MLDFRNHLLDKLVNCCHSFSSPGPNAYSLTDCFKQNNRRNRGFSWGGRQNLTLKSGPGPAAYRPDKNIVKQSIKGCPIGKQKRSSKIEIQPGPGQYSPSQKHLKNHPRPVIGSQPKSFQNILQGPGPGKYQDQSACANHSSPKYSIPHSLSKNKVAQSPAPNAYNISKEIPQRGVKIGKEQRQFRENSESPGPCAYNSVSRPKSAVPSFAFGRQSRQSFAKQKVPGPGTYSAVDQISKNLQKNKGFSMSSKLNKHERQELPGPGFYNPKRANSASSVSIGKQKKGNKKQDKNPGPGTYNIQQQIISKFQNSPKCNFGKQKKSPNFIQLNFNPGPANYHPLHTASSPKFSIRPKTSLPLTQPTPGPATYLTKTQKMTSMGVIGKESRQSRKQAQQPGPGQYNQGRKQGVKFSFPKTNHHTCVVQFKN